MADGILGLSPKNYGRHSLLPELKISGLIDKTIVSFSNAFYKTSTTTAHYLHQPSLQPYLLPFVFAFARAPLSPRALAPRSSRRRGHRFSRPPRPRNIGAPVRVRLGRGGGRKGIAHRPHITSRNTARALL